MSDLVAVSRDALAKWLADNLDDDMRSPGWDKMPDVDRQYWRDLAAQAPVATVEAHREQIARDALAELVALKDGPRDEDYERRKPLAWAAARAALTPKGPADE